MPRLQIVLKRGSITFIDDMRVYLIIDFTRTKFMIPLMYCDYAGLKHMAGNSWPV